ncbi:MAG: hypothetical protein ACR2LK_15310 [Solirubrobacteraceae bacterium]
MLFVGALVLALTALATTIASADRAPLSAEQQACVTTETRDGYLDLYRQSGAAFPSQGACRGYATTKELVHLAITRTGFLSDVKGTFFLSEETGYGLQPGSGVSQCRIVPDGDVCLPPRTVAADGTFAATNGVHREPDVPGPYEGDLGTFFCSAPNPSALEGIYLVGTTAAGSPIRSRMAPAHCGWLS